jgi:proline iminopeptidase
MTPIKGYVKTDGGIQLFVQALGSGSRLVVIPNATYMFADFKYLADERTIAFYDLRNRGRSEHISDESRITGGVHNDVEDLEAVRRHFNVETVDMIGHSYLGMVVALYAMKYPTHVNRLVMIGSVQPLMETQYPAHLTGADATMAEVSAKLSELQKEGQSLGADELGRRMWLLMRQLYVADPANADKINWDVADLPNESLVRLMKYYNNHILPSMQRVKLTSEDFARVAIPVLIIHGKRDRQAPYGGAQDWAKMLPNARLITIENGAHLPWIESPEIVFSSIKTFFDGEWPDEAR